MIKALLLLTAAIVLGAGALRAEMWCGRGSLTPLEHPCESAPKAAVSAAVRKYRNEWIDLIKAVWRVESAAPKNGSEEILVYVDPTLGLTESTRSQIPASIEGIPVVLLPDRMPSGGMNIAGHYSSYPASPEADEAGNRSNREREASEKAYRLVVHKYGDDWLAVPGVLGIGPSSCDANRCDFGAVGIVVQRQLLNLTRSKIPSSVDGVPTILIPQD